MQLRSATWTRVLLGGFVLLLLSFGVRAQTAISEPLRISNPAAASSVRPSDSLIPTAHVEFGLAEEAGADLEDSEEMLRVEIERRAPGTDRVTLEPKVSQKAVRNLRPIISPPLLV
jgi:hypothetical protein